MFLRLLLSFALFIIFLILWRALSDVLWCDSSPNDWIDMMLGAAENEGKENKGKKWHSLMALGYMLSGVVVVWGLTILNRRTIAQGHTAQTQLATIKSDIFDKAIDKLSSEKNIDQQAGLFMLRDLAYKTNDKYREDTKNHIREPQDYTSIIMSLVIKILNSFENAPITKKDIFEIKPWDINLSFKPSIDLKSINKKAEDKNKKITIENSSITMERAGYDKISMSKSIPIFSKDDAIEIKQLIIDLFFKPSIDPKSIMQMYRENKKVRDENKEVTITATLLGIDMSEVYLEKVKLPSDLSGINFFKADLSGINISSGGNLSGAGFVKAKLKGVRITFLNIRDANFKGADLSDSDFTGSDFTGCQNLTLAQLAKAKCLYNVIGLDADHVKELRKNNPKIFKPLKNDIN